MASRWSHFIVHHSAGPDSAALDVASFERYHRRKGWSDIGYHWVVERGPDGLYVAVMGRPMSRSGSHAGRQWNGRAVGICFAGNFETSTMPVEQLREGAQLIAGLGVALEIPNERDRIKPHHEVRPTACPGANFPLEDLRTFVTAYRGGNLRPELGNVRLA